MRMLMSAVMAVIVAGCATGYGAAGMTGGYRDMHVAEDVYRVSFGANGHATRETAQTYWLYRAAELTIEKGFDGFEIISPIQLGRVHSVDGMQKAAFIYIPMPMNGPAKPYFEADIRLLKGPIAVSPPKRFDARALMVALDPYVKAEKKCNGGNVCPHIKKYLQSESEGEKSL